ncbi:MAG: DUF177 domain-containing protein, partial [Solobacterium sp.]|nr:DUF177 domain-containing protein [Solobacterium sp.]
KEIFIVRWTRSELAASDEVNVHFDETPEIDEAYFRSNSRINAVKNVRVTGRGFLDEDNDRFWVNMTVSGIMLVPDAVSGEEIEYPFETESEEVYAFDAVQEDGVRRADGEIIDLLEAVVDDIILEVPMQYSITSPEDYPSGDGWRVISEEEYQKSQEDRIDPRLAKLKDYKVE